MFGEKERPLGVVKETGDSRHWTRQTPRGPRDTRLPLNPWANGPGVNYVLKCLLVSPVHWTVSVC